MEENRIVIEFERSESPEEAAAASKQDEQFDRNSAWLQAHILEIGEKYRGKCICIAGQQLFVADTVEEAVSQATAAHPEDTGWFTRYRLVHTIYPQGKGGKDLCSAKASGRYATTVHGLRFAARIRPVCSRKHWT